MLFEKTPPKEISKLPKKIEIQPLWELKDIPNLAKESDVIVKGKVVKILPSVELPSIVQPIYIGENEIKEAEERGETDFIGILVSEEAERAEEIQKSGGRVPHYNYRAKTKADAERLKKELESDTFICTDKVIEVDEYLKNPLGKDEIIVREQGGKIGNTTWAIVGYTPLRVGDEVILFLRDLEKTFLKRYQSAWEPVKNRYQILAGPSGKFYIEGDRAVNKDVPELSKSLSELEAEVEK